MFIQNQANTGFGRFLIFVLISLLLIGFYANFAEANPIKTAYKYQEIKAIAKGLKKQQTPEELGKLVEKSNEFIAFHPEYKRVDEVYYLLGNALVQLERVEEGIKVFEELVEKQPDARYVRNSLLELGLAYDKLGKYDEADMAYKKLTDHPKYGSGSHATFAKQILEQERADRKGELPRAPGAQPAVGSNPSQWIGQPATDFQVTGLDGEELSLEKYRGQVVLLDFWATWCGPCIVEIPNVKKTYEMYKDQKFQIIGISLDRSREPLEAYIEEEGLAWLHYWDNTRKVSRLYEVQAIPSTFLIDGEGVIRKTNLRGHALEHAVAELVKENLANPTDTATKTTEPTPRSKSVPATKLVKPETPPQKATSANDLQGRTMAWVGKPAPDFQLTGLNGETLSLEQYRGQVVLLDFWATWCGPCIVEMPKVKKTYQAYKDQKFQIIGISLDRSREPLDAYIEKEGIGWRNYWDEDRSIRTLYGVQAIPTAFLIDGEGVIRKASLGGFDVETAVAELVKENLAKPTDAPIDTPADTPEGAQNLEPDAEEIIHAAIAAHGGLEKLEAVKSFVMESHSFEHFPDGSMQDEGKSKIYYYANKFRSEWNDDNRNGAMIFDGESLYMIADGEVKLLPPEPGESYADFFKDSLSREPVWLLPKLLKDDVPVQYLGTEEVKGVPASVLLVTQPSGKELKIFISEETHYIVQFSYETKIGGGGVENVDAFFEDYRDIDGIKIPHHRVTKNGEYRQVLITDIALNAEIDDALFRPQE